MEKVIQIYDTTLRDGTQGEEIHFSAEDKLKIARRLDDMGVAYIEGGWPGSNPKDERFFRIVKGVEFKNAKITAFGSTRKPGNSCEEDQNIRALMDAETQSVTIVGKTWDMHAREILGVSLDENLKMIDESIRYLKKAGKEVIFDAEHFFDGYRNNPSYAIRCLKVAEDAGSDIIVLCDTNGGTMPHELGNIIDEVKSTIITPLGIHAHNDCGLAVANSITAVLSGVEMVQGTVNGYGERCGNADIITIIGNLQIKMGYRCIKDERLSHLTELSRFVSEVANIPPFNRGPFVGKSAFAHKGGIHVHAIAKNPSAYEHIDPKLVGNRRRVLVSDLSGKSNIEVKSKEMGIELGGNGYDSRKIVEEIKRLEDEGYQFDAAEGSLELLLRKLTGQFKDPFRLESFRVTVEKDRSGPATAHATIKISVGNEDEITAAEGDGPVSALDNALRKALNKFYPQIQEMGLVDFKVRVIDGSKGTGAKVRVQIESRDSKNIWSTIGVSENIIEASWQALSDSVQYKLLKLSNE